MLLISEPPANLKISDNPDWLLWGPDFSWLGSYVDLEKSKLSADKMPGIK